MENLSPQIKNSLRYSIYDGIFYFLMVGMGESFFIPYALFLHADTTQIGLLGSLPQLFGSLMQLTSNRVARVIRSRKKFVCLGAFAQSFLFLPMILILWIPYQPVHLFILMVCLYTLAGLIIVPAWSSWMGDLVPENKRGWYFGRRNRITGLFTLVSMVAAGVILVQFQKRPESQALGFAILFAFAFIFRLASAYFLTKKWDPPAPANQEEILGIRRVMRDPAFKDFRKLTLYLVSMNFAVFLSAPYFIPYMLDTLKMDYLTFTLTQGTIILSKYLTMPLWGKVSDKYGSLKVMVLCGLAIPMVPFFWLFHDTVGYLMLIQLFSGIVWAGFELASFNMILDHTPARARVAGVSYLNALSGLGVFAGAMLGARIVQWSPLFEISYLFVFLVSGLVRFLVAGLLLFKLKEARTVESISLRALIFRPFSDLSLRGLYQVLPRFRTREK